MKNDTHTHAKPLHDLIQILTERLEIYSAAISAADTDRDVGLIAFLEKCMQLTQQFKSELNGALAKEDRAFSEQEWAPGHLYSRWQDHRHSVELLGRDKLIDASEKTEDALLGIFREILANTNNFTENTTAMLKSQAALQEEIVAEIKDTKKANAKEE